MIDQSNERMNESNKQWHAVVRNRDGNGSVGHGSWVKWVTILDGSRGSRIIDP